MIINNKNLLNIFFLSTIFLVMIFVSVGCGNANRATNDQKAPDISIPVKPGPFISAEMVTSNPTFGNTSAKLKIVMFEDFECPYCLESFSVVRRLMLKYQSQVQFIFRDFPVLELHPTAMTPALAGRCALGKGKFWELHDRIFQEQKFDRDSLIALAGQVGLNVSDFTTCLDQKIYQDSVNKDIALVKSFGGTGTPTYIVNGYRIAGTLPYDNWVKIIDDFLAKNK